MKKIALVLTLSSLAIGAMAQTPLGDASTFNAFIFGNYTLGNEADAAVAVGGSVINHGSYTMNGQDHKGTLGTTTGIDLYGGANSSVTSGSVNGNGGAIYLGTGSKFTANNNASASVNIGANTTQATAFAKDETYLKSLSSTLASYTVASGKAYDFNINYNGAGTNNGNNAQFLGEAGKSFGLGTQNNLSFTFGGSNGIQANFVSNGVNVYVFDITASELSKLDSEAGNITFNGLNATNNLIINVIGDGTNAVTWHPQQQTNGDTAYTLYNFVNTPTVNTNQQFTGSILATGSTVDQQNGNIQGNVIANSLIQTSELHFGSDGNGNYKGWVPQAVPEPAPFVVLGLGGLIFLVRRKS